MGLVSTALLFAGPLMADEAETLLKKMTSAAHGMSYQGDFIYERAGSFSTHRVWRQANGEVVERLLRTDGTPQEWLRRNDALECTSAPTAGAAPSDRAMLPEQAPTLQQWYSLEVLGSGRVANRAVTVLSVQPRDSFRYAHELYLDVDSGLLLQALLVDEKGALLERFQFTNLQLGSVDPKNLSAASTCLAVNEESVVTSLANDRWLPAWVPPGFAPIRREARQSADSDLPIVTQIFTDGFARFTVFIEPLVDGQVAADLLAQLGPTIAVSRRLDTPGGAFMATVVGEIPPVTAGRIVASLSPDFDSQAFIEANP
ncbi:MucB/RseB C-terminal domain-containing protein [Halopseudomonas salina]|uniref:MucB/RseB C-terminal domain-containing protein n=1 Tax=Halopseudomonas salina TaxID=1323744 RepID=UPI00123AC8A1|nr:MucB/RseB C-terminal domain-containing protein [Halopseudomonas salina]